MTDGLESKSCVFIIHVFLGILLFFEQYSLYLYKRQKTRVLILRRAKSTESLWCFLAFTFKILKSILYGSGPLLKPSRKGTAILILGTLRQICFRVNRICAWTCANFEHTQLRAKFTQNQHQFHTTQNDIQHGCRKVENSVDKLQASSDIIDFRSPSTLC